MIGPTSGSSTSRGSRSRTAIDLVTAVQEVERALPARLADEVGDDEDERPTIARLPTCVEQRAEVGRGGASETRLGQEVVDEAEDLDPPATGGDRPLDPVVVEDRPDPVAVPGQQPGQRRHEVDEDGPLLAIAVDRPEVHRRAEVEQEPGGDLAILGVLRGRRACPSARSRSSRCSGRRRPAGTRAGRRGPPRPRRTGSGSRPGAGRPAGGRPASRGAGGCAQALTRTSSCSRSGTTGAGMRLRRVVRTLSAVMSSESASNDRTSRWRMTSRAMSRTSWGRA